MHGYHEEENKNVNTFTASYLNTQQP